MDTEVLVMGGGPAGASCALGLARAGRAVVLCEAVSFPRDHVGISLSPGVAHQLQFLGVAHVLQNQAHRAAVPMERRWGSCDFVPAPSEAFIADRGQFDFDLLAAAANAGVQVIQPARIRNLTHRTEGWITDLQVPTGMQRIFSRFVIDARGRSSSRSGRRRSGAPTVAVYGQWSGNNVRPVVRIGTADTSWSWTAPNAAMRRLAVSFTSPDSLRRMQGSIEQRYRRLLDDAAVLESGLTLDAGPRVCDATPYVREDHESGLLRIGDADAALDPLSSSGVQAAIQSALCAAPVVNTILTPRADAAAALEYWSARRTARAATHRAWSADRYAEASGFHETDFWSMRAANAPPSTPATIKNTPFPSSGQLLKLSEQAVFVETPCLIGKLVIRTECLSHPNLPEPVAYVDGFFLPSMLQTLREKKSASQVVSIWTSVCSPEKALSLLGWLWRHEIAAAS